MDIQALLKFGQIAHLEELLAGHVYINHSSFFKKDIDHGVYDKHEGLASIFHLNNSTIQIKPVQSNEWKTLPIEKGTLHSWYSMDDYHIYSLYGISVDYARNNEFLVFSKELKTMGEAFLTIANPKRFFERLLSSLEKNNLAYEHGWVDYYDSSDNHKNLSVFHKAKKYAYQNEYRFMIKSYTSGPIRLNIGSLSDIAEISTTKKTHGIRFDWQD